MKTLKHIAPLLLSILGPSTGFLAFGWDNPGHMAVAGLAYDELSGPQQGRLVALLRQHPGLSLISEGFSNGRPSGRNLMMAAATWPDLAKGSKDYQENGYETEDPPITTVSFDHLKHRGWHFIASPLWVGQGPAPGQLPPAPRVNAVGVVNVLVSQLGTSEADDAKAYDLGWLLHLVGDLDQPLHAVAGFSETYPDGQGDRGGNGVHIKGVTRSETELHAFWDDILGKTAHADRRTHHPRLDKDVATAANIITQVQSIPLGTDADNIKPEDWAKESFNLAQQDAYDLVLEPVPTDRGAKLEATLDTNYGDTATRDAQQRIRAAGHRLALLLKRTLQ
jgi:hypothetical protein